MADNNPIYKFMKDNGLTQKDEATFVKEYSDPVKTQELYQFMVDNSLTTKSIDDFSAEYFPKLQEVGGQPLTPTSEALQGLIPSTENQKPEQIGTNAYQQLQDGELLGQSLADVGDYNQKTFIDDKSYDSAKNALIKISDYESGRTQLSDEELSQYNKEYADFLASKGGLPTVQTQGTWKEPFTGQWNFDTRGYEYFEPDENTLLNAGGWDNLADYFKKNHPNVILTRTNLVDQGDGQAAVANTETVNEDTAKPAFNPVDYLRQQELNQIPIEQWSDRDKMALWDSQIRDTNIKYGNFSEEDADSANRKAVAEADRKNDQESGYIFNTLSKLATLSEDAGMVAASTLANLLGVPEFGWDVVAEAVGAKSYRDVFGEDILLQGQRGLKEVVKRKEDYNAIRFGDAPIWEDFRDGRLNDGANKIASSLGQSLTYMAMLMSGNTGSMAAFLSGAEGQYLKLQQDNPDMDRGLKLLNSGLFSAAEIVPERIGLNSMMKPFYKLYQKEGAAIATGALEKALRKYVGGLAVITPHVEEMSTEYATMLMQNAIAKYSGEDPNRSLIEGWQDTGITSLAMSGVLSGPSQIANSIVDSGRRRKVEGLLQQNFDIERAMQGYAENAPERVMMSTQYYRNLQMINGYIETQYEELGADGLSDKKKDDIRTFMEQRQRLMDLTASENIPESVKEGAQEDIDAINDQITDVLKEEEVENKVVPGLMQVSDNLIEKNPELSRFEDKWVKKDGDRIQVFETPYEGAEMLYDSNFKAPDLPSEITNGVTENQVSNENIEVPSETPVENVQVAPLGEQVQGQGEVVAENKPVEQVSQVTEQTPSQEEIVVPTQVNEPVSDKVNPKLKEVIKSVPNQDLNTLMGPANVEARRDVIETVTGKRPSKNDAGITRVKQVVADYLGVTGNDSQKVQAIKNWANFERTEFSSPEEATRYAAENTTDPQDILLMYDEQPQLDQSDKGIAIAQWLGDKGKINLSDFTRWGDRNNLTRDISYRRIDTGDNLMGLDAQLEADGLAAQGITPEDVVNFVTNYKDEADYRQVNKSETEKLLEDRYKALTGRNITPKALDRFRQQSATERANLAAEQEANQSLAEAGVTQEELAAQQQMEAEQGREPRQESTGKTPKSLLKGIADRLSETGLAKSVKITDSQGVSDILGRMNNVNFQLGDAISKFMNLGLFSKGDFTRSISGNIIGLKKSVATEIEVERLGIKERAQKNGTWLKAPNGKATNLRPDEWVTVRTKRFKEWFGDWENNPRRSSKIVDENGEPAIYYNGSKTSFNEYDKKYFYSGEGAMHYGAGFYFTPRPETAQSYSRQSVLMDYIKKTREVVDSLGASKLDRLIDRMPRYTRENSEYFNKNLDNFLNAYNDSLNEVKDRISKSKDNIEKNILQDVYHGMAVGYDDISSFIENKRRTGFEDDYSLSNDLGDRLDKSLYNSTTKSGIATDIGVGEGVVASLFLNVKNPLNWEAPANIGLINKVNEELRKRGLKPIGSIQKNNGSVYAEVAVSLNEPLVKGTNFRQYTQTSELFESIGIDGVLHTTQTQWTRGAYFNQAAGEVQVIAFEPNQIKSTANVGTFKSGMNDMRFQQNQDVINGFVDADGNIVINSDNAGIDTPIHEFGHIWERTMETANPELHARGMELIRGEDGQPYVDYVRQTQPGLQGDAIYKEALAQVIGDNGARLIETQKRSVIKEWLKAAWDFIASLRGLSGMTPSEIANLTLREYAEGAAVDLLQGKPINKTPMGNMVMETKATAEKEMTPAEKFNADFIRRRQQAMSTYFSGEISDLLSDSDFRDYVEFTKNAIDMGQIPGKAEHDTLAAQLGITNAGQIDLAYKLATLRAKQATGIQTGQVSKDALDMANFESMSDTELRDAGRQLVEQGLVDPVSMVRDIISKPRPISAQEVAALQYYQSTLNGEYANVSDLLDSRDQASIDAYSFQGERGFKGLSIKADVLRQASYDLDLAIIASGKEQSAAFRLRSVLSDKDFNIVSFLADMKSRGYITKDQEAKFNAMAKELSDIKAKLKQADDRAEKRKTKIAEGNMEEVAKRNPRAPRRNRPEVVEAFTDVLGGLNPDDFGITGMNFQKGLVQFSMQPNTALGQAVSDAIGRMQQNVKSGTMNVGEAIETAISEINNTVGEGNWDAIKFRSTIMNRMTNKSQIIKAAKPYINSNGTLIIPGAYLTDLVKQGYDTIDAMVAQANTELGGQFSEYDIRNAISGYGRQAAPKLNEIEHKKNVARTIARLLSELEDLNTKGERAKTEKVKHEIDNRIRALRDEIKQREYDLEMTPEERAQLAEQRYSDARKKYLENYIKQLQERIDNGDFAPQKHVNKYEDSPEVEELKARAERLKNDFKKAKYEHELATMSIEQKTAKFIYEFVFNSTRALAAGSDLSAIGVQGAIFAFARPAQAAKLLWGSRKQTFSQKEYEDYFAHMQTDPYFDLARKTGVNLQLPGFYQSVQEEQFKGDVGSIIENYAFKPVARGIAKVTGGTRQGADKFVESYSPLSAADRNYAVVLSSIRLDLFKEFLNNQIVKNGLNTEIDIDKVKQIAEMVNTITMAATVPFTKGNKAANAITSALFFSLRKMIATWKILGMWAPMTYNSIRGDAMTKAFNRQLLRDTYGGIILNGLGRMLALGSLPFIAGAVYGFGGDDDDPEKDSALEAGARYMYNPNFYNAKHSDFLKIRLGDTRISLFQGIDGNIVLGTRLASQEYMTSSSNAVKELNGVGGNKTMRQLGIDYLANKLAPTASLVWQYTGTERERGEMGDRFTGSIFPMWMSSAYEQFEATDKPYEAIALGALGVIGLSYNNYGGAEFATREGTNNAQVRKIFKDSGLSAFNPSSGTRTYFDGEKVQKAKDPFLGGKGYFSKEYLPAYEEFMNEAVLSNKDKFAVNVDWSIKEGLVNNLKREAYKYAEIKTTGVAMGANFKNFSVDGEDYTLLPSQYKLKAKYIKLLMEDYATPKYLTELAKDIRDSDPKITPKRAQMLALIAAYNEANSEAKFNLMDDYEAGKIKLIKRTDYTKDMEKEDLDSEE